MIKKRGKRRYFILGITILILVILFILLKYDLFISQKITSLQGIDIIDNIFLWITYLGSTIIILFFLTSLFLWHERKRRWIFPLWFSFISSTIIAIIGKIIIDRIRPFELGISTFHNIADFSYWNTSFPSFHAMLAFSALPVLDKEFPYFKYFWFLFALLVAFSRIFIGVHYLSDVLIGAIIGYIVGYVFVKLEDRYKYGKWLLILLKKRK